MRPIRTTRPVGRAALKLAVIPAAVPEHSTTTSAWSWDASLGSATCAMPMVRVSSRREALGSTTTTSDAPRAALAWAASCPTAPPPMTTTALTVFEAGAPQRPHTNSERFG